MKTIRYMFVLTVAVLPLISVQAQTNASVPAPATSVSTREILKLEAAGLSSDIILSYIGNVQSAFNLSADDLVALKSSGASSQVLAAMINHDLALHPPVVQTNMVASANAVPAVIVTNEPVVPAEQTLQPVASVAVIPPSPGVDYAWTPGYRVWRGGAWVWVAGSWAYRPRPATLWARDHGGHRRDDGVWGWH